MADDTVSEEWRLIEGFPDYEVSDQGYVRRATDSWGYSALTNSICIRFRAGRPLRIHSDITGRRSVNLWVERRSTTIKVAILVCRAFRGPRPSEDHVAAHRDGNPGNDWAGNLEWITHKENSQDMARHGRSQRGSKNVNTKLTENDVRRIRELLAAGRSERKTAVRFGISTGAVRSIKIRESWDWLD